MKGCLVRILAPMCIGIVGGIISDRLGYSDLNTFEHWIVPGVMLLIYVFFVETLD